MRVVGICLVRNEERYLGQALANVYDFCDEILIADNGSIDSTWEVAQAWARQKKKISCARIKHPRESHEMIEKFVNTPTWIFAVDGDELYDPEGLLKFRESVLSGKYDSSWQVNGNVLNCIRLDPAADKAEGYLSPPSRCITKFFNFNAITEWSRVENERLHGGHIVFKPGYGHSTRYPLNEQAGWNESVFRCLHLCFLPRSSLDRTGKDGLVARWNLAEQDSKGILVKMYSMFLKKIGLYRSSKWKMERYARGSLVSSPVRKFFDKSAKP